jgi:chaperonin GroES
MKLKALNDKILILPDPLETITTGGIVLPDTAERIMEKTRTGLVVGIGNGKQTSLGAVIPPGVEVGDRVLYDKFSGTQVKVEGQDLLLTEEEYILAII